MTMKFDVSRCTVCGELAKGTLELVPGVALLVFDETGEAEYEGETTLDWNGQATRRDDEGRVTLECSNGHRWQARLTDEATHDRAQRDSPEPHETRRRWVLYDFDSDRLLTTRVYASYDEGIEAAAPTNDVLVLPLVVETIVLETVQENTAVDQDLQGYALKIGGPLLRSQRGLLVKLLKSAHRGVPYVPEANDKDRLEGVVALLDEIADQAHDRYGIDCLLEETPEPGAAGTTP